MDLTALYITLGVIVCIIVGYYAICMWTTFVSVIVYLLTKEYIWAQEQRAMSLLHATV